MSIRKTAFLLFLGFLVAYLALSYGISRFFLLDSYQAIETAYQRRHLDILSGEIASLGRQVLLVNQDWAFWDDSYAFVRGGDPEYIASNLNFSSLANIEVDFVIYLDEKGQVVYQGQVDRKAAGLVDLRPDFLSDVRSRVEALRIDDRPQGRMGFFPVLGRPVLVAISPVLRSDLSGPSTGLLVFGRHFDAEPLAGLARRTGARLSLVTRDQWRAQIPFLAGEQTMPSLPAPRVDPDTFLSYLFLGDPAGMGVYAVVMEHEREHNLFTQGVATLGKIQMLSAASILLLAILFLFLQRRLVLDPIGRIIADVSDISSGIEGGRPVVESGPAELRQLSGAINGMLARLTESLRATEESHRRFTAIFENAATGIVLAGLDRVVRECNPAICRMLGYRCDELVGKSVAMFSHPEDEEENVARFRQLLAGEIHFIQMQKRYLRRDGSMFWGLLSVTLLNDGEGRPEFLVAMVEDISELRQATDALRLSEERYRTVVESSSDAFFLAGEEGILQQVNRRFLTLYGYRDAGEVVGRSFGDFVQAEDRPRILGCLQRSGSCAGQADVCQFQGRCRDGSVVHCEMAISSAEMEERCSSVVFVRDISYRRKMEAELARTERLEGIGVLAAGIAHDFNNLLTAVFGYVELALHSRTVQEVGQYLQEARKAIGKAKELTRQLLTFAKGGEPQKELANLAHLAEETCRLTLGGTGYRHAITATADLWLAMIDRPQMVQVVQNILHNAMEAMPDGGTVRISLENHVATAGQGTPPPGRYVKMTITDEGAGIPAEILGRVFDPYFSTKPLGADKGTGMGLAICHSIVSRHQGHIAVASEAGGGTTLTLYVPAAREGREVAEREPVVADPSPGLFRGRKVLVMDDEESVTTVVREMLQNLGCTVVCAASGDAALASHRNAIASGAPFDALILDLSVPGGKGAREIVEEILAGDSGVAVIVASGYTDDEVMVDYRRYGFKAALVKPFALDALRATLAQLF
ncbi:MAG: PAS domain S-box protein [Thermodesulfobacteriota bacterium]